MNSLSCRHRGGAPNRAGKHLLGEDWPHGVHADPQLLAVPGRRGAEEGQLQLKVEDPGEGLTEAASIGGSGSTLPIPPRCSK